MSDLAAFQIAFLNNMQQRLQRTQSTPSSADFELYDELIPALKLSPEQALQVYAEDYRVRLTQVLSDHFPAIHFLLGDAEFLALSLDFLTAQPSRHFDLGQFGALLSDFLERHTSRVAFPFLAQLAALEWELNQIFHQAFWPGSDLSPMQSTADPGSLCFRFIPSLRLWHSPYTLFEIWNACKSADKDFNKELKCKQPQSLISYKNQRGVRVSRLTGLQTPLLEKLLAGHSLEQALDELETHPEAGTEIAGLFALLKQEGLVISLST